MLPAKTKTSKAPSAFSRALTRMKAHQETRRAARIGFVIDATGSRQWNWIEAQKTQARMFKSLGANAMALRLVHFGGFSVTDHGWLADSKEVAGRMAETGCLSGPTQIVTSLAIFADDTHAQGADAIIVVGDCFEEDPASLEAVSRKLGARGVKIFSFLEEYEGADRRGDTAFRMMANLTDGRFAVFGRDMPLGDLCEGVALLTQGGAKAAKRIKNRQVKRLLLSGPDSR